METQNNIYLLINLKIGNESKVYKLKKTIYNLKQAPQTCYNRIDVVLKECYKNFPYEHTIFVKIGD